TLTFESARLLDMDATVSDGWRPGREQAEQTTGWWLKVTKIGYLGHDAHGRFQPDRPAKGAVLNMQETVDQTGRTPVAGATTNTITLNNKGEGTFPYHRIKAGQTRWYKVWESKAPAPLQVPQGGAYWIVKAVNTTGSQGATLTITGSSAETRWLLKGAAAGDKVDTVSPGSGLTSRPVVWRQTLGDTIMQGVTPPVTGNGFDLGRAALVGGGVILLIALLGITVVRLRRRGIHTA
ncbi:hypothetical protein Uis1B_2002, partial [Bifidobacterium margollesii]